MLIYACRYFSACLVYQTIHGRLGPTSPFPLLALYPSTTGTTLGHDMVTVLSSNGGGW